MSFDPVTAGVAGLLDGRIRPSRRQNTDYPYEVYVPSGLPNPPVVRFGWWQMRTLEGAGRLLRAREQPPRKRRLRMKRLATQQERQSRTCLATWTTMHRQRIRIHKLNTDHLINILRMQLQTGGIDRPHPGVVRVLHARLGLPRTGPCITSEFLEDLFNAQVL